MENFFDALEDLCTENSVKADFIIDKIKSAMLKAVKRIYPNSEDRIKVEIDTKSQKFAMYILQDIVKGEPINENEINIEVAKSIDTKAILGGTIRKKIKLSELSRMSALSAKQSIKSDLREINREKILSKFAFKEHDCITAKISQIESGGTVTVDYDGIELYLFGNEQIPGETLIEGHNIKVYITGIISKTKKPIVKISRIHKNFVKRLFELEVPEICEGIIEIKGIAREAGFRTKMAVWSKDPDIDAVGSCIGQNRSRITAVSNELNGEKIDIIRWSEDPASFIASALAPAKVLKIDISSMRAKTCNVIVPKNQISLAIGNKGQNAKLAAKLTNFRIDIKPANNKVIDNKMFEIRNSSVVPIY